MEFHRISGPPAKVTVHNTAHFENILSSTQSAVFTSSESRSLLRRLDICRGGLWSYREELGDLQTIFLTKFTKSKVYFDLK